MSKKPAESKDPAKESPQTQAPRKRTGIGARLAGSMTAGFIAHQEIVGTMDRENDTNLWTARPIDLSSIDPNPYQPRLRFVGIEALAQLIDEQGLQQPITVRPHGDRYQIVSGERRFRAHKLLKKALILAHTRTISDQEMSALAMAENLGREDLTDYELSRSLIRHKREFGSGSQTHEEFGLSKTLYYRLLSFEQLPPPVNDYLDTAPDMISGLTAETLARIFKKRTEEGMSLELVHKALITIVQKASATGGPIKNLGAQLEAKLGGEPSAKITPQKIEGNGGQIGQVKTTKSHFELKLNRSIFTQEHLQQIEDFVKNLTAAR